MASSNYEKIKSDGSLLGNVLEWVDARFPLTENWKGHLSEYYAPKNFNLPSPASSTSCATCPGAG